MNVKFVGLLQVCRSLVKPERNLSYVSRVREIQKLKEDKQYCEQVFGSSGLYLLYVKVSSTDKMNDISTAVLEIQQK